MLGIHEFTSFQEKIEHHFDFLQLQIVLNITTYQLNQAMSGIHESFAQNWLNSGQLTTAPAYI